MVDSEYRKLGGVIIRTNNSPTLAIGKIINFIWNSLFEGRAIRWSGYNAMLADLRWRPEEQDEPVWTIRFAKILALSLGTVKLTYWPPNLLLRKALAKEFFFQRKESPGFNYFSHDEQ